MLVAFLLVAGVAFLLHRLLLSKGKKPEWWSKHGIKEIDPSVIATNLEILLGLKTVSARDDFTYEQMGSDKFCGVMDMPSPIVLVKDLDLMKKILIKDFDHFVDRRDFFTVVDKSKPIAKMLGLLKGDEWKGVRSSVSPVFTTGKIRRMMEHFNSVGKDWANMLKSKADAKLNGSMDIDVMSTSNQFTLEVIAQSVFGIKTGTIENPQSIFAKMAYRMTEFSFTQMIKFNLSPRYPSIFKFFGIEVFDTEAFDFFEQIVRQGMEARKKSGVKRNDFQEMLLETRMGELKVEGSDELNAFEEEAVIKGLTGKGQYLTDEMIIAQSVLFFVAGFMGTSNLIGTAAYALAVHPDIQERLRKELDEVFKDDGTMDYDDLGKLVYLDMVVNEVLRKYPAATRLERIAQKEYTDPESGLYLPKGTVIAVPVYSIHNDPKFYKNPDKFDPEHFSPENKAARGSYAFLPFGLGPRNCIGMRFALMESKAAIAHLVHNFHIEPTKSTPIPMEIRKVGLITLPPKKLSLKITPV